MRAPLPRPTPRPALCLLLALVATALAACNTVRGAGEDARSIGRVFSSHPNGPDRPS